MPTNRQRWEMKSFLKDVLGVFITVLVHQIIYLKKIYPDCIYEKRRKFNVPVYMSKQPWVNDYITRAVEDIKKNISDKKAVAAIKSVSVIIARKGQGYQKFRLQMPLKLKDVWYEDLGYKTPDFREKLERLFSDTLLRLCQVVAGLRPEPEEEEREWWLVMAAARRSGRRAVMKRSQDWCRMSSSQYSKADKSLVPVMAFRDPLPFQLYIEACQEDAIINNQQEEELVVEEEDDEEEDMFAWHHQELPQREEDIEIYPDGKVPIVELPDIEWEEDMFAEDQEEEAGNDQEKKEEEEEDVVVMSDEDMFAESD